MKLRHGQWVKDTRYGGVWQVRKYAGQFRVWRETTGYGTAGDWEDFEPISEQEAREALSNEQGNPSAETPDAR